MTRRHSTVAPGSEVAERDGDLVVVGTEFAFKGGEGLSVVARFEIGTPSSGC
jgi:hypothetical protein